ncbi:hypothetical protein C8N25_114104 [Algoriphagus antarcticus]|uniref:Uncharacterized protein n=1 Tax=Algoriphagus antarcticus TaxID=238540 RepID=A0A3E0DR24_9BACT|nr:hypothetical protein C8N25_114104 [Algoriphagus antarcticus]
MDINLSLKPYFLLISNSLKYFYKSVDFLPSPTYTASDLLAN